MLKIEERAEKFAYGYVEGFDPTDEKRGLMCTAHVCGQNEMLDAIRKEHELVRIQDHPGPINAGDEVIFNKQLRKAIDQNIQQVKMLPSSRERSLAITKLQEAVMWLGMDLKRLNEANPYPSSKDPSTGTKIEPTADGLKM